MERQQLMEKFCWALRTSMLRRSSLGSLGMVLVYLQSFWTRAAWNYGSLPEPWGLVSATASAIESLYVVEVAVNWQPSCHSVRVPKIDTRPVRLTTQAWAVVSCSSISSPTGAGAEDGSEAESELRRSLSSPSLVDHASLPSLSGEEHDEYRNDFGRHGIQVILSAEQHPSHPQSWCPGGAYEVDFNVGWRN